MSWFNALMTLIEGNELSYLQFADSLFGHEISVRTTKRIEAHRRQAGFLVEKHLEEFDYRHQTYVTRREVKQLLDFSFIGNRSSLIFVKPPGVAKTHLAAGLGLKAILAGYKVLFITALSLVEILELAQIKRELKKKISLLCKYNRLIIDELGYLPMNKQSNHNLFQSINALYEYRSD